MDTRNNGSDARSIIKELEQQVGLADARCGSLKSQLNYMKMLYNVRLDSSEIMQNTQVSSPTGSLFRPSSIEDDAKVDSDEIKCKMYIEEIRKIQEKTKDDAVNHSSHSSPRRPLKALPAGDVRSCYRIEHDDQILEQKHVETKTMQSTCNNKTNLFRSPTNSARQEHNDDELQQSFTPQVPSLQQNILSPKNFIENINIGDKEYVREVMSARKPKRQELILDLPDNINSERINKVKSRSATEKRRTINSTDKKLSVCKIDEPIVTKIRRRKTRLRSSNSKSTVNTKVTGKKDLKKKRHRTYNAPHTLHQVLPLRPVQNSNEAVELYHNVAVKSGSSISAFSSKNSKLNNRQIKNFHNRSKSITQNESAIHKKIGKILESHKQDNYEQVPKQEDQLNFSARSYQNDKNINMGNQSPKENKNKAEDLAEKCKAHECQHLMFGSNYFDPLAVHSYEMSTFASRLKRANRSYFNRFNFKNIPFVVGTSINPSHNLGLNIQQVLSIMKTRQTKVNGGVTPLLIRKVSKGIKPVTMLMEELHRPYNYGMYNQENNMISPMSTEEFCMHKPTGILSNLQAYNTLPQVIEENQNSCGDTIKQEDIKLDMQKGKGKGTTKNLERRPFTSYQNLQHSFEASGFLPKKQDKLNGIEGSESNTFLQSQNMKGIREVFINLHDQFEEMNIKYEKLQKEREKTDDKSLNEEISRLEKELNAKEEEINAVVGLYKEVMVLKRQMKMLQEQNSLVCIASEVPVSSTKITSPLQLSSNKCSASKMFQTYQLNKGNNAMSAVRKPSTSIQLAGLLRQIQTFQKQLKLTS